MPKQKLDMDDLLGKIVKLVARHPPKNLTFSKVSRLTKIPRSTLYYYFGKDKDGMIEEAAKFGMGAFVQIYSLDNLDDYKTWKDFQFDRMHHAIKIMAKYPWAPQLYFRYRNNETEIGRSLIRVENKYVAGMQKAWRHFHGSEPNEKAVRLMGYLKLGLLFGWSMESKIWTDSDKDGAKKFNEGMLHYVTQIMTGTLKQKF